MMEDIKCDDTVVQLSFHPSENLLAGAKLNGRISLWKFDNWTLINEHELEHHKSSCRAVKFSTRGNLLFSISKDRSLQTYDLHAEKVANVIPGAHKCAPYSLEVIDNYTLATGDDDGRVKVWDLRQSNAVMDLKEMEEFVSSLTSSKDKRLLIATSGEGTLTVFNHRAKRMVMQSELFETELICASFVKGGNKFVVGCGDGIINIFNNNEWGNFSDHYPCLEKDSIDCLTYINDNFICIGSADGIIRAVHILPNKIVGIVGEHEDSVENMVLSNDAKVLASCGQDNLVKFWNVDYLHKFVVKSKKNRRKSKKQPHLQSSRKQDFFNDLKDESE